MKSLFATSILMCCFFIHSQEHISCSHKHTHSGPDLKNVQNNMRSDTIDVLDYKIYLDITDFTTKVVVGSCRVKFTTKLDDVAGISLDLLQMNIDSVKQGNQHISYTYNDTLLRATFVSPLANGLIDSVTVYYQGVPQGDPSGWGGFYFTSTYAYNLGVGFEANPHNYGRVWHPCFDNFVERATYEISVRTLGTKRAYSNGYITNEDTSVPGEMIRTWQMDDPIPTYLACVGVSDYVHVNQTYVSPNYGSSIPVMLIAQAGDTTNLKNSFANLHSAMEIYEEQYGPYLWNKIGYALVPFNSGAMEHATCIMYPLATINGSLTYESLMAHELSHHWWGNLVTCRTSADMWINEGMARYSESIFLENQYGYNSYMDDIKSAHRNVLQRAHYDDGDFYPISGVPHLATYGTHTYEKGATAMHNLRTYMGDNAFFEGLNAIQTDYIHMDINAAEFRDKLMESSSLDLTEFFDDWVYSPGFPGFVVDSFQVVMNGGNYDVTVYVKQKLRRTTELYSNVPLEVSFMDENRNVTTFDMTADGEQTVVNFTIPFNPALVYLNGNDKILQAVTAENQLVTSNTTTFNDYAYFRLTSAGIAAGDTALVRMEHCRVAPDEIQSWSIFDEYQISTERYWKVDGIWSENYIPSAWLTFDARNTIGGNLDNDLLTNPYGTSFREDSLVLFWRPNTASDWSIYPHYTINTQGSATDGVGRAVVSEVMKGEYAFGYHFGATGLTELTKEDAKFSIYPNPTNDEVQFKLDDELSNEKIDIQIVDASGKFVLSTSINKDGKLDVSKLQSGTYFVSLRVKNKSLGTVRLVKN